jgi:hypothetical protein
MDVMQIVQLIEESAQRFDCGTEFYGPGAYGSEGLFSDVRRHIKNDLKDSGLTPEEIHLVASVCADSAIREGGKIRLVLGNDNELEMLLATIGDRLEIAQGTTHKMV